MVFLLKVFTGTMRELVDLAICPNMHWISLVSQWYKETSVVFVSLKHSQLLG